MAHKFEDKQKVDSQGFMTRAKGDVEDGKDMFWISAVIYQNEPGHYAAAEGTFPFPGGGVAKKWECPMTMAPGSKPFKKNKPAKAWALARVSNNGGEFYAWGHPVDLH
jgi:hypothetical protein